MATTVCDRRHGAVGQEIAAAAKPSRAARWVSAITCPGRPPRTALLPAPSETLWLGLT